MDKSGTQKDVSLGYEVRSIKERLRRDQATIEHFKEFIKSGQAFIKHILSKNQARIKHRRTKCEQCRDTSRYVHYSEAFRITMCETDIKAWLEREDYNGYGNRRLSQAFIRYLMSKYGLSHWDVLKASERVRYRIHG